MCMFCCPIVPKHYEEIDKSKFPPALLAFFDKIVSTVEKDFENEKKMEEYRLHQIKLKQQQYYAQFGKHSSLPNDFKPFIKSHDNQMNLEESTQDVSKMDYNFQIHETTSNEADSMRTFKIQSPRFQTIDSDHKDDDLFQHFISKKNSQNEMHKKERRKKIFLSYTKTCRKCHAVKPPRTHHCSTCQRFIDRCICRMDHHCPWVNNCVGYYTMKHFTLFLFYISVACLTAFFIMGINGFQLLNGTVQYFIQHPFIALVGVIGTFFDILFGLFAVLMFGDQISTMTETVSYIDKIQGNEFKQKSFKTCFTESFGEKFTLKWLIPVQTCTTLDIEKEYTEIDLSKEYF